MKKIKLIVLISLLCGNILVPAAFTQTGPGGVGGSATNALWLRANAGTSTTTNGVAISTWNDQSGNANDVTQANIAQRPLYNTNVMNGYPAIQFDNNSAAGQNDFLSGVDAATLDNTNGLTIFTVTRMNNLGNARSIIAKRTNVGVNQAYMFFYYTTNYMWLDVVSNDNRFNTNPTAYSPGTNYILDFHFDGTLAAASRVKIYTNHSLTTTSTESATTIPDYASPFIVGSTHVGDNRPFGGYIAEIIIFRTALGTASRIIIDNYLAAKYGITLGLNDIYTMDNAGFGNFDHDVAGIGRESATDLNVDAQGSAILRILNPTDLNNNEYFIWGHNNLIQQAIDSDVPAGVAARFQRVWRASEVNKSTAAVEIGSFDMRWDLSGLGPVTASDLRLLVDEDNDGIFADETPISGAVSLGGGIYEFSGVAIIGDQNRFTLATINLIQTPLPIELISFKASIYNRTSVQVNWTTKSETNNDYFVVQHAKDGYSWIDKFQIDGAGNSIQTLNYNVIDETPHKTENYYRLKQVDFDGSFTYSEICFVELGAIDLGVYPNPSNGFITISGLSANTEFITIKNSLGQIVYQIFKQEFEEKQTITIDLSIFPAGHYFATTNLGSLRFVKL